MVHPHPTKVRVAYSVDFKRYVYQNILKVTYLVLISVILWGFVYARVHFECYRDMIAPISSRLSILFHALMLLGNGWFFEGGNVWGFFWFW